MGRWVDISFRCLPLRSVPHFTPPVDASDQQAAIYQKLRVASQKHGLHNSYYLHDGKCAFHLTNHELIGLLQFSFEGTLLTDVEDMKTLQCDLQVELQSEVCSWLAPQAVQWFADSVREAVKIEFDSFIEAGDLDKTVQRLEELHSTSDARGGFLGLGI
jgi:hypothetical protein